MKGERDGVDSGIQGFSSLLGKDRMEHQAHDMVAGSRGRGPALMGSLLSFYFIQVLWSIECCYTYLRRNYLGSMVE